jgi:hypothetical protein
MRVEPDAAPAGVASQATLPGGSGDPLGRHYDRSARSSLDWDRLKAGNALQRHVPGKAAWS